MAVILGVKLLYISVITVKIVLLMGHSILRVGNAHYQRCLFVHVYFRLLPAKSNVKCAGAFFSFISPPKHMIHRA